LKDRISVAAPAWSIAGPSSVKCGMISLILSACLVISVFAPTEPIDYLFLWLSSTFGLVPEAFILLSDLLMLCAGVLSAYSVHSLLSVAERLSPGLAYSSKLGDIGTRFKVDGRLSLVAAAVIVVYWHVPASLDATVLSYPLHLLMNEMMFFAGFLMWVGGSRLSDRTRHFATILGCKAMGIFGIYLLVTSGYSRFYDVYPLVQQTQLGLLMVVLMFSFEAVFIPWWLYAYFTKH